MIQIAEALRWLNQFDQSHLNVISQQLIATARNQRTSSAAIQDSIQAALQQARTSPRDSLDYPETLLNCAVIEFDRGLTQRTRDHLTAAVQSYIRGKDPHGAAVASWMLGIAELALLNPDSSYTSWKKALRTFDRLRDTNTHILSTRDWYTCASIKMNQDLITLPHEAFSWLNQFTASRLSASNRDLADIVDENIKNNNGNEAARLINVLKERAKASPDPVESAEIFLETGIAHFRMLEWLPSIADLKVAVTNCSTQSHQQEVARWILGAVQFWSDKHRVEALQNWEKSLTGFSELAQKADRNNRQLEKRWYRERVTYMKAALKGKITEYFS